MPVLDYVVQKSLELKKVQKDLEMSATEALECCKQNLMDDSAQNLEDQNADRNVDHKARQIQEVLGGNENSLTFGLEASYNDYTLAENLSTFCLCSQTLPETEFMVGELINLMKKRKFQGNQTFRSSNEHYWLL